MPYEDRRYEARYGDQYAYPPRYPPVVHNNNYSENGSRRETVQSTTARVPSPSFDSTPSYDDRVPSPPPARQQRRERELRASAVHSLADPSPAFFTGPSPAYRLPSPPPRYPRIPVPTTRPGQPPDTAPRTFGYQQVPLRPTAPSFDYRRHSYDIRSRPPPRNPQAQTPPQRFDDGYPTPPTDFGFSSPGGRPQGLKRSNSERNSNGRMSTPTQQQQAEQSWANKSTGSVDLTNSAFTSSALLSGVLGDRAYQYNTLEDMQLRLVRVLPERKTMIKCEILHVSIENPPPYVAISYAWGDPGNTRKIELGGALIPISVSLYGALEALRQKTESVMVWVDALCIDQQNKDERTQQVQLMTSIYSTADSVAIWLGPEEDDSDLAAELLQKVADQASDPAKVSRILSSNLGQSGLPAVVSLFERDYWRRLWVVQEVFNARSITVYCGTTKLPWDTYQLASHAFARHRRDLDQAFPGSRRDSRRITLSPNQLSASQVLVYQGPASLPDLGSYMNLGENALLAVLRACRRKITSDAKDKLFGVLGALPGEIRKDFRADYSLSVKDVYTEVVDYLLKTTERVDVICDAIHFPIHTGSANLPSYVPDWSHIPQNAAMGHMYSFEAGATTKAICRFLDERLNKLEMSAIYLDTIALHGVSVGTICTLGDYLMAFLHWRALLLGSLEKDKETTEYSFLVQEQFCKTMALGQVPSEYNNSDDQWLTTTYGVFASLLRKRLPHLPLDSELQRYADIKIDIKPDECRQFLQKHFGDRMMGRCFCRTEDGRIGMGSGLMLPGDIVVVPLGCSTPILLRLEGTRGEHRFVGDVYINGYMHGRAVDQWKDGKRKLKKYVLH